MMEQGRFLDSRVALTTFLNSSFAANSWKAKAQEMIRMMSEGWSPDLKSVPCILQTCEISFPLVKHHIFLQVVARLTAGHQIFSFAEPPSWNRDSVIHAQLTGRDGFPAVMTVVSCPEVFPPLTLTYLSRFFFFSTQMFRIWENPVRFFQNYCSFGLQFGALSSKSLGVLVNRLLPVPSINIT